MFSKKSGNFKISSNLCQNDEKEKTGPRSAVGNVSGYRCVSDCRSRGREFEPAQEKVWLSELTVPQ